MIKQNKSPDRKIFFAGETVTFYMSAAPARRKGRAVLRTNIGQSAIQRQEMIEKSEFNRTPRGGDWHDLEMDKSAAGFQITLPLAEPGIFEAKCCFIPDDGSSIIWATGDNFKLKVHPANSVTANGIYCAFVRQFGKWANLPHSPEMPEIINELDRENYTVVPPSGTFRNLISKLDHIFGTLHCSILQP